MRQAPNVALLRVATPMRRYHSTEEHLGLGYLASYLRVRGATCTILDMPAMQISSDEALRQLVELRPCLIGFTVDYANEQATGAFLTALRQRIPDTILFVGGHHVTLAAESFLHRHPETDVVVLGEGEETLHKMWQASTTGKDLLQVPGIVIRSRGNLLRTMGNVAIPDVSSLPHPSRDSLVSQLSRGDQPVARVISARGCPGRCSFCTSPGFFATQGAGVWRPRQPEDIVEEIADLFHNFSVRLIIFSEDNSLGWEGNGHSRFLRIADLLLEREIRIKFRIMGRVDNLRDTPEDEGFLKKLKTAGLQRIYFGFDGGSSTALQTYDKDVRVSNVLATKRLLDRLNISIGVGFINFNPYSTLEELRNNGRFLQRTGFGVNFDHFASSLELYPGVRIIDCLAKDNLLGHVDQETGLHRFKFQHPRLEALLRFLEGIRDELYEVDCFAWRLVHMKQNLREWLEELERREDYLPHRIKANGLAKALTDCHATAFTDYLDLFSSDMDAEAFSRRALKHLDEARSYVLGYESALDSIDALLNETPHHGAYGQRDIIRWLVSAMRNMSLPIKARL